MGLLKRCVRKAARKQGRSQFRSGEPCMISILSILVSEGFLQLYSDATHVCFIQTYRWRSGFQMNPSEKHESGANMFMEVGLSMQQFKVFLCTYHVQFQLERICLEQFNMKMIMAYIYKHCFVQKLRNQALYMYRFYRF